MAGSVCDLAAFGPKLDPRSRMNHSVVLSKAGHPHSCEDLERDFKGELSKKWRWIASGRGFMGVEDDG